MIETERLHGGYGETPVLRNIHFQVEKGEFFAILGPNGSGKSTLFKLLTGVLPAQSGFVRLAGRRLEEYSAVDRARIIAVLAQEEQVSFDFTVREIVLLGRYPHQQGWFKTVSAEDERVAEEAMSLTKVAAFRDTPFAELSGGEKQRVLLAKALAQEPQVLLLDEPTNHLDMRHTFDILSLLKQWQASRQLTVLAILHDLNVASLYADRVALLHEGQLVEVGDVSLLKNERQLERVYGVQVHAQYHPHLPKPQLFLTPEMTGCDALGRFEEAYEVSRTDRVIHIAFRRPLRTISNGVNGEGLQWLRHFCNFHVDMNYDGAHPQEDIRGWIRDLGLPFEQTAGMMTAVYLKDAAFVRAASAHYELLVMATAGVGNSVDITRALQPGPEPAAVPPPGTINIMVLIDGHLTDGALVNALISATEAKTKALFDMNVRDPQSGTIATGTSTDSVLIAATQRGKPTSYAGSGTEIGKLLGSSVHQAVTRSLVRYFASKGASADE